MHEETCRLSSDIIGAENKKRSILCAASCFFCKLQTLPHHQLTHTFIYCIFYLAFSFSFYSLHSSPVGEPTLKKKKKAQSLFLSYLDLFTPLLAVRVGAKGVQWLRNRRSNFQKAKKKNRAYETEGYKWLVDLAGFARWLLSITPPLAHSRAWLWPSFSVCPGLVFPPAPPWSADSGQRCSMTEGS